MVADDQHAAGSAVVGAGAVIVGAPPEFGEHQHYDIVCGVVFAQVVEEVADGGGKVVPQAGQHIGLAGVGIKTAVVAVEHARSQAREVNLGDALEFLGEGSVGVLYG